MVSSYLLQCSTLWVLSEVHDFFESTLHGISNVFYNIYTRVEMAKLHESIDQTNIPVTVTSHYETCGNAMEMFEQANLSARMQNMNKCTTSEKILCCG